MLPSISAWLLYCPFLGISERARLGMWQKAKSKFRVPTSNMMQDVAFFSVLSGSPLYLLVLFSLGFWSKQKTQFKLSVSYIWHCSAELKVWFSIKYLWINKFSHKNYSRESSLHSSGKTRLICFISTKFCWREPGLSSLTRANRSILLLRQKPGQNHQRLSNPFIPNG